MREGTAKSPGVSVVEGKGTVEAEVEGVGGGGDDGGEEEAGVAAHAHHHHLPGLEAATRPQSSVITLPTVILNEGCRLRFTTRRPLKDDDVAGI